MQKHHFSLTLFLRSSILGIHSQGLSTISTSKTTTETPGGRWWGYGDNRCGPCSRATFGHISTLRPNRSWTHAHLQLVQVTVVSLPHNMIIVADVCWLHQLCELLSLLSLLYQTKSKCYCLPTGSSNTATKSVDVLTIATLQNRGCSHITSAAGGGGGGMANADHCWRRGEGE